MQTGIIVAASVAFGAGVWATMGANSGLEWFSGYLLEESLSVDNLFVFILLFKVPIPRRCLSPFFPHAQCAAAYLSSRPPHALHLHGV